MGKCKFSCRQGNQEVCCRVMTGDVDNQAGGPLCEGFDEDKDDCPEWSGKK